MFKSIDISGASFSIRSASFVQLVSKSINVVVQLAITMVLARLLTPAEYGTVAVLQVFTALFSVFADSGISVAIARSNELQRSDYERLFFLGLLMGLVLSIAFFALSAGVALFYGNQIYISLGAVLMLAVMFNSLNTVPNGILIKELKFKLIALRLVVCSTVVGLFSIALAFLGFGCFAIVLNSVLTALFVFVWNLKGSGLRMSIGGVRGVFEKVGSFSLYSLGNGVIFWVASNADTLLVGKLFGAEALGYYNKAYGLYAYPLNILTAPIVDTLVPFLAKLQDSLEAFRDKFMRVIRKISFLSALCLVGMHVCAYEIILIMFGNTWIAAIPLLSTLAFAVYSRGVNAAFSALLNAAGRPDLLMKSTGINTCITLAMIAIGGFLGTTEKLATCIVVAYNLEMILPIVFCARICLDMSVLRFIGNLLPDIFAAVLTCLLAAVVPWGTDAVLLSLTLKVIFVCLVMFTIKAFVMRLVFREKITGIKDFL